MNTVFWALFLHCQNIFRAEMAQSTLEKLACMPMPMCDHVYSLQIAISEFARDMWH